MRKRGGEASPDVESPTIFDDAPVDDDEGPPVKRRPWGPEEDEHLRQLVDQYGIKSWALIATNLSNRNGKQCRERWRNHLRPQLNKGDWSAQEDVDIWDHVRRWAPREQISEMHMPQRTDNDIKNGGTRSSSASTTRRGARETRRNRRAPRPGSARTRGRRRNGATTARAAAAGRARRAAPSAAAGGAGGSGAGRGGGRMILGDDSSPAVCFSLAWRGRRRRRAADGRGGRGARRGSR